MDFLFLRTPKGKCFVSKGIIVESGDNLQEKVILLFDEAQFSALGIIGR